MSLLSELHRQGISARLDGGNVKLSSDTPPTAEIVERVRAHKAELIDQLQTQNLKAALMRLELGETPAVRIRINAREQVLILKDDETPESITVDCPTFTLDELRLLIGSKPWQIAQIYDLKADFGDCRMRVTDIEAVKP